MSTGASSGSATGARLRRGQRARRRRRPDPAALDRRPGRGRRPGPRDHHRARRAGPRRRCYASARAWRRAGCGQMVVLDPRRAGRARRGSPSTTRTATRSSASGSCATTSASDESVVSTAHQHFQCRPMSSSVARHGTQPVARPRPRGHRCRRPDALTRLLADHAVAPARRVWGLPAPVPEGVQPSDVSRQPVETAHGIDWIGP